MPWWFWLILGLLGGGGVVFAYFVWIFLDDWF